MEDKQERAKRIIELQKTKEGLLKELEARDKKLELRRKRQEEEHLLQTAIASIITPFLFVKT